MTASETVNQSFFVVVGLPSQSAGLGLGAASGSPWQPQGVLTAHLAEHSKGVNQLALAGNGLFFVSVSNDETAKVWDGRRLERDVSFKSRLTYTQQGMSWSALPCNVPQQHTP